MMGPQPDELVIAPPPSRSNWSRWGIVGLLMAFTFISHFNRVSISSAADSRIMDQYAIEPTRMGYVYSAFLLVYTFSMIPGGWLIDRYGARIALMVVGFGSALFQALTGVVGLVSGEVSPFLGLLIVRGLMGGVSAPLHPACAQAVGDWIPPGSRSWSNGLVTGAALLGIAVTQVGFGAMVDRFDWPVAFLITGAATATLAVVWTFYTSGRQAPVQPASEFSYGPTGVIRSLIGDRSLIMLTLSYAAVGYFQYLFVYWMNYFFLTIRHLPIQTSRFYSSIPVLAMAVSMPLGGWLSDRLERASPGRSNRAVVPVGGMIAGAVFLALGIAASDPVWVVIWFALAMGAVGMGEGPFWATAIELGGRRGGTSAALFNTGGNLGGMLAPIVTPWVGEHYGWPWAIALGGLICLVGASFWIWIDPRKLSQHRG
ncbi:MFS transporter [Tundrisphaera lichenicola]|uniref:MFS transporter n=1 Tax=Tundrisphaera lichenicola TaxID=2029860 RepID=UPI003EB73B92